MLRPSDRMMLLPLLSIAVKPKKPALDRLPMESALLRAWREETYFGGQEHPESIPP